MKNFVIVFIVAAAILSSTAVLNGKEEELVIRVGYFPNITHSQAIIGMANGSFQDKMGDNVRISAKTFNAGPSVIEAIFAGEIDLVDKFVFGRIESDIRHRWG